MSVMAANHRRVTNPRWIAQNIEIVRWSSGGGSLRCATCHCSPLTQQEFADAVGVSPSAVSAFLRQGTGRPDVIAKMVGAVARVVHE